MSAVCLLFPDGKRALCEGALEGQIAARTKGDPGMGYDAVFELKGGKTIAETGSAVVDGFNHRQKAM